MRSFDFESATLRRSRRRVCLRSVLRVGETARYNFVRMGIAIRDWGIQSCEGERDKKGEEKVFDKMCKTKRTERERT